MEKPFFQLNADQFIILPRDIKIIAGYEIPKNEETGKQFPYCCPFHQRVYEDAQVWFDKFPDCCEPHKELKKHVGFDKSNYVKTAQKAVSQLSYTEHFITERIALTDWYKDITDYIDYNIFSFGTPPVGLHIYLQSLNQFIKRKEKNVIPKEKQVLLVNFINDILTPKKASPVDLNILFDTYKKWLTIFPFDISYFKKAKEYFENQFPVLQDKGSFNPYTGFTQVKVQTQSGLVEWLNQITKILLQTINSVDSIKKGLITDTEKHALELLNESHRMKQLSLVGEFSNEEIQYVNVLDKWLTNERDYFKEVIPLLKKTSNELKQEESNEGKNELIKNGLLTIPTLKDLDPLQQSKVIDFIFNNEPPYQIAMLNFLGFITYLLKDKTKNDVCTFLAKALGTKFRAVKGNINVLNDYSEEDRSRYTSHLHKETVQKDYNSIK